MILSNFESDLNERIINRYIEQRVFYNESIKICRKILADKNIETNKDGVKANLAELVEKRNQIQRLIDALRKRKKTSIYYNPRTKYKVLGSAESYDSISQSLEKLRKINQLANVANENFMNSDVKDSTKFSDRRKDNKLLLRLERLEKKAGKIEAKQRRIIMEQVEKVGQESYGLTPTYDKKATLFERLKEQKIAIVAGFREFKSVMKTEKNIKPKPPEKSKIKNQLRTDKEALLIGYNQFRMTMKSDLAQYKKAEEEKEPIERTFKEKLSDQKAAILVGYSEFKAAMFNKEKNKPSILSKLRTEKEAIIVGFREFRSTMHNDLSAYAIKK